MIGEPFDPRSEWNVREHFRPHWSQSEAVVFITFRTHDSIPREVVIQWDELKSQWLRHRGLAVGKHWSSVVETLNEKDRLDFLKEFNRTRETFLDACHGRCLLKRPELAQVVADALLHFDGLRYQMGDFIVMPNHVHLLVSFPSADTLHHQCGSWLHYTAVRINRATGGRGKFWQQEPFDHLVRSPEQYDYLRNYIADNPKKAGLVPGEYLYRRRTDG